LLERIWQESRGQFEAGMGQLSGGHLGRHIPIRC